jgi:hypothetical protein
MQEKSLQSFKMFGQVVKEKLLEEIVHARTHGRTDGRTDNRQWAITKHCPQVS